MPDVFQVIRIGHPSRSMRSNTGSGRVQVAICGGMTHLHEVRRACGSRHVHAGAGVLEVRNARQRAGAAVVRLHKVGEDWTRRNGMVSLWASPPGEG